MKSWLAFLFGICTGLFLMLLYLHRRVIKAALCGEELPKVPAGCPAYQPENEENC